MSKKPNPNKLTPWFPADVKPARKGVYQVSDCFWADRVGYAYWNGRRFGFRAADDPSMAHLHRNSLTLFPERTSWRGLAENPIPSQEAST